MRASRVVAEHNGVATDRGLLDDGTVDVIRLQPTDLLCPEYSHDG